MMVSDKKSEIELFYEITSHLLEDEKPSYYMNTLLGDTQYHFYPFLLLWKLKDTKQSPVYHPEGSAWNHTLLVLDEAAAVRGRTNDRTAFMWAALLHDLGKPSTTRTRKGKTTSYDHDREGEKLSIDFLSFFLEDQDFIYKVAALVRYHMHMLYILKKLPYGDIKGLLKSVDKNDLALLCRCDRLGRAGADIEAVNEEYDKFRRILEMQD